MGYFYSEAGVSLCLFLETDSLYLHSPRETRGRERREGGKGEREKEGEREGEGEGEREGRERAREREREGEREREKGRKRAIEKNWEA